MYVSESESRTVVGRERGVEREREKEREREREREPLEETVVRVWLWQFKFTSFNTFLNR